MSPDSTDRRSEQKLAPANAELPVHGRDELLVLAHQRSQELGVAVHQQPDWSVPGKGDWSQILEESRFLFQHAAPVMETLYQQIVNTHSMVVLTSSNGLVLHSLGDSDFMEKASRVALMPGVDWSEKAKGTNAVGTALTEREALTVHGDQHYMAANQSLTCSCAPIIDPQGQLIGALDVSGDYRSYQQHTLALVRMSAQMIENHMFAGSFPDAIRLHFHARPEFLGTLVEGIAVFTRDGRFISANRSAQFQLGLSFSALQAHTFPSLFGMSMSALFELFGHGPVTTPRQLHMHDGVKVWCRARIKQTKLWSAPIAAEAPSALPAEADAPRRAQVARVARSAQFSSLQYLDTGDAQIRAIIGKLRRVVDRDIPVMILGETGTGKDLLARAIHNDSARARRNFVAVNCASIPESLIEAELFGYEEGAFTGARKKGAVGKIALAHGGTLFLDEIGDMPRPLQARLLRVLQERRVNPLGSDKEVEVDVTVISATHKNLKEMIARGEFREDLYYRLNGLVVRLPALRERTDFEIVIHRVLKQLRGEGPDIDIAPEVMALLARYHWPGNMRQLHNLLRTAVVMVGDEGSIELQHLPDDFLEDLQGSANPWSGAAAAEDSAGLIQGPDVQARGVPARGMPAATGFAGPVSGPQDPPAPAADASGSADSRSDPQNLQDVALQAMARMLRLHKGNVSAAAKALGVSRNTIYRKKPFLPPDLL
ncbi:MAG: sigma-54-dependent Fis family transcriptional regulator [Burkholderiaceae bacterium]